MLGPALNRLFIFFKVFYSYLVQTTVWCLIYASGNHAWMLKYTNTTAVLCSIKALHWYNCTGWLGIKHQVTYFSINAPSLSGEWLKALFPFRHQTFHADLKIFTPPPPAFFVSFLALTHHSSSTSFRITMISPSLNVSSSSLSASQSYRALQRRRFFCYT